MSYSTSNPPSLISQGIGNNAPAIWQYNTADTVGTVGGAGYITNGGQLGMKVGDWVLVYVNTGTTAISSFKVVTVATTGTGATTLSGTGVTVGNAS